MFIFYFCFFSGTLVISFALLHYPSAVTVIFSTILMHLMLLLFILRYPYIYFHYLPLYLLLLFYCFPNVFFMPFDRFVNFIDIVVLGIEIALELQKASNSGLQCFGHFARIYYFCLWCGKCICVLQGFDYKEKHSIYLTHILV